MKLSTRARYGTRALLGIVLHWDEVKKAVDSVLESTTFEDLVERQKQKLSQ
jgi:DNA-binding IscR family transcriptional regulator